MKLERSKNAKRNMAFGLLNNITSLLLPFVVRTVLIKVLGEQYLGLSSLFSSILSVLSLAELGFGSAVVYNMYKPVAENDTETLCALLNFYRRIYHTVGFVILAIGLMFIPLLPKLIKGTYPSDIDLTTLYLIFLGNSVLSYFLFGYRGSVLSAYQRNDVNSRTAILMSFLLSGSQIAVLFLIRNYYVYVLLMPVFTILNNLRIAWIVHKMFPQIKPKGKLERDIIQDIKKRVGGLMVSKLCGTSRNALDSIFTSAFIGLTMTAMYNNYYYIVSAITGILSIVCSSVIGGVGNSIVTESVEKNYSDMNRLNFIYMTLSGWCTICLFCLFQPFMKIWMGEKLMFPMLIVVLFCAYFYVLRMGDIRFVYAEANGLWWENRYRAVAEAACNLVLNYILGKYFGVYGIISATLISLFFINFCYGSTIIFKYYFIEQKVSEYFLQHFLYLFVTAVIGAATYWTCSLVRLGDWPTLLVRAAISCVVPTMLYVLAYIRYPLGREATKWVLQRVR